MKDTFRKEYNPMHPKNTGLIVDIKVMAESIEEVFLKVKNREMSLAMTNLEQCIMWAIKAIVLADQDNGSKPIE